ncbi:MAG: hypothetical protein WDZ45_03985 [Flavobacteriaceae bacterium]
MFKYSCLLLFFGALLFSCVKDTDFDQADAITPSQEVEVNFVFFTLEIDDFQMNPLSEGSLTVIDTTEVRFLDDDFAIDNIVAAEFFFKVTNTFPVGLVADFTFLSEENEPFFNINFPIQISEDGSPVITEFSQLVTAEDIELLTLNDKVVVTITIETENQTLEGVLNLQSKTTYFLEFSDL